MDGSVIEDRACAGCGARNRAGAEYCWQCYTPFAGAVSTSPRAGGVKAGLLGASPSAGPGQFPSEGGTSVIARATAPFAKLDVPPPERRRAPWRSIVPWVLIAAVAVAGWSLWQRAGGFQLPPALAGAARMEGSLAEEIDRRLEPARDVYEGEIAAAVYGSGPTPTYALFLIEQVEGTDGQASLTGLQGATGPIPLAGLELVSQSGSDIACGSAEAQGDFGTLCLWEDAQSIGLLTAFGVDIEQARAAAQEARYAV